MYDVDLDWIPIQKYCRNTDLEKFEIKPLTTFPSECFCVDSCFVILHCFVFVEGSAAG